MQSNGKSDTGLDVELDYQSLIFQGCFQQKIVRINVLARTKTVTVT